uniref:G protein-coupled receptor n=1 Tax=Caenorhabditis tropicalis TaxID=1561998 RepID=A0A1I7TG58_9PELO
MSTTEAPDEGLTPPEPSFLFQSNMLAAYVLQLLATVFYSSTLYVVHRIRVTDKRSAPFYTIFFSIGVFDVLHAFALMWMCFEKEVIQGDALTYVTFVCSFLTCFCYLVNIIGNGLMAFNRWAATYNFYPALFSTFGTWIYIASVVIIALVSSIPAIFRERVYAYEDGEWRYSLEPKWLINFQRFIIIGWMVVYFAMAPLFTGWAWYRINNFISMSRYHTSDKTLLYFNSAHMLFHFGIFFYEIYEIYQPDNFYVAFVHRNFYICLFSAVMLNSFTLACTTIRVRQGLSKLWCRVVNMSRGKVSSSQQTVPIFNVSGRY